MSPSPLLYQARGLAFAYRLGVETVPALQQVDLDINRGEFLLLTGPSGSGKSTLLSLLGLIEPMQDGRLTFEGQDVTAISERQKNQVRRFRLGFIFQAFHLLAALHADENVDYFLARQGLPRADRQQRVEETLRAVGLWEHRKKRPGELSGGQRQRVAVARALAKQPAVILADEPTASLDQATGRELLSLLKSLATERGVTIIMASHDPMAEHFAERRLRLVDGRLAS